MSRPNAGIFGNPKVGVLDAVGNAQKDGHSARSALMIEWLKTSTLRLVRNGGRKRYLKDAVSGVERGSRRWVM
jgi:hypothetical protein